MSVLMSFLVLPCLALCLAWHVGSRWDGGRGSLDRVDYRPPPPPPGAHNVGNLLHMAGGIQTYVKCMHVALKDNHY